MHKTKGKFPIGLHVNILQRFLSDKELTDLYSRYQEACYRRMSMRAVTPLDRKIFKDYKEGMMIGELGEKYGKARGNILYIIAIAARE